MRTGRWAAVGIVGVLIALLASSPAAARGLSSYRSPGYHWNHKLPRVAPVLPGPVINLGDGADPQVFVDAAGTGQIAYTTMPNAAPSVLHDCVLLRGQTGCASTTGLIPPESGDPRFNNDDGGPTPLAIGNELLLLDHRYPNVETLPDGTSGYPTFLWTSEDGGRTFTGPGTIGNLDANGNAIVFGGNQPQIGWITDTVTGGTFFQSTPAGAFTSARLNLGDQGPDEAYDGRLALDGTTPVAEFQDLSNHIYIREYNGSGDITNSASWSVVEIPGQGYSRLVGGPSGVWLLYQKTYSGPLFLQRIVHGQPSGSASQVTPNANFSHAYYAITEDASGRITVGWFAGYPTALYVSSSTDGRHWSAPQVIARGLQQPIKLSLAAAGDGGGFAAFQTPEPSGPSGAQIEIAAFGTFAATHKQGLGNLDGGGIGGLGGDPLASVSCTDVHFGDIDAIAEAGCFLRDPANPSGGAAVIQGSIRLNGLEIVPDAGVEIAIDPRQHTINTTGAVRVILRAPGINDITLYHGELHVSLAGSLADAGQTLFDFNTATASGLEGFPLAGSIDVQIAHDAVVIPVSLALPAYMGGITGQATLLADNASGLHLSSLHIGVDDLVLGALEVKDVSINYTESGSEWDGTATVDIPAGTSYFGINVAVRFDHGDFTMGSFSVNLPFPGAPIFTDTYLDGFGGGFDIHPQSRRFFGNVTIGAIPLDPPNYTISVTGTVAITFTDNGPVVLEVDGSGTVHGYAIANAKLLFETSGYLEVDGNVDLDLDVAELQAGLSAFVDLQHRQFSASASGQLRVFGTSDIGAQAVISSTGVAACGTLYGLSAGFAYPWGGSVQLLGPGSCDLSPYALQPMPAAAARGRHGERVATVHTAAGAPIEDLQVRGNGAPPSVILRGPGGRTLTPTPIGPGSAASPAVAASVAASNTTYVMIRNPGAGSWTVSAAPGSSAITAVLAARAFQPATIRAKVADVGSRRRLTYAIRTHRGLTVTFAARSRGSYQVIGHTARAQGAFVFGPAQGPAGRRTVYAIVSEDGVPRESFAVATFSAPSAVLPSRVRTLHVNRRRRRFVIAFGDAMGASYYLVRINGSDGRRLLILLRGGRHALTLPMIGYADHLTVAVTAVSTFGRRGATVSART